MEKETGYVHLYVGDGKGKTTAAMGLAVRALGCGRKVLIFQLLKGPYSGELGPLATLGARLLHAKQTGKFTFQMNAEELQECREDHKRVWEELCAAVHGGEVDLAVLDEAVDAVNSGILAMEDLLLLVRNRPPHVEMVLTGRNPAQEIIDIADYYTTFTCLKHPYRQGVAARKGVEF